MASEIVMNASGDQPVEMPMITCTECGETKSVKEFVLRRKGRGKLPTLCDACKKKAKSERTRERQKRWRLANPEKNKRRAEQWNTVNPDKRRAVKLRRKFLLANARQEPYKAIDIFERDNWICHICGEGIHKSVRYPHPRSASLDHVIPLSAGGADAPDNVKCSHFFCNTSKNDRSLEECITEVVALAKRRNAT